IQKLIYCLLLSTFSMVSTAFAQKKSEDDPNKSLTKVKKAKSAAEIGDKYFENYEYYLAAQEYVKAVEEDPGYLYALYKAAESFRLYFNYDKAQLYYQKLIDTDKSAYPLSRYWYALMLKNRGEYEKALENFEL